MKNIEFLISVVLTIIIALYVSLVVQGDGIAKVKLAIAYGGMVLFFLFGFMILAAIASGKIDISKLLEESGGGASLSRFQLLIFTFVVGLSLFMIVVGTGVFPKIPTEVLTLLGISATTYGVSKGIQAAGGLAPKGEGAEAPPPAAAEGGGDAGGQN
jgi:hypothetical protein